MVFARTRCLSSTYTSQCTSTYIVYTSNTRDIRPDHHHTADTLIDQIHTRHDTHVHTSRQRTPPKIQDTHDRRPPACVLEISRARPPSSRVSTHDDARGDDADRSIERAYFCTLEKSSSASRRGVARGGRSSDSCIHSSVGRSVTRIDSIVDSFDGFLATARARRGETDPERRERTHVYS